MFLGEVFAYNGMCLHKSVVSLSAGVVQSTSLVDYASSNCIFRIYDSTYDYRDLDFKGLCVACQGDFIGKVNDNVFAIPLFIHKTLLKVLKIDEYSENFALLCQLLYRGSLSYTFLDNNKYVMCFGNLGDESFMAGCYPLKCNIDEFKRDIYKCRFVSCR